LFWNSCCVHDTFFNVINLKSNIFESFKAGLYIFKSNPQNITISIWPY